MTDGLSPESDLLLHCASVTIDDASKNHVAALCKRDLDWNEIIAGAEWHGLTPLVYWHLKSICQESVPTDQMVAISELFMSHLRRNVALSAELVELVDLFEAHGITVIPLKGPVLAENCYGNTALRTSGDLDIFIPKEAVSMAYRLLRERGYVPGLWQNQKLEDQFIASEQFTRLCWEYDFVKENEGISVDLHWQLMDTEFLKLSSAELMQRVSTCMFQGKRMRVFNDELTLIFLCAHASKHGWYRISWIVDIAQLLERMSNVNWDALFDLAETAGAERMVLLGIYLTKHLPRQHLSSELDRRICADPAVKRLGDEIVNRCLRELTAPEWVGSRKWAFVLSLKERWPEKIRLLCRLASQPTLDEWIRWPMPDDQSWLYFLLRPLNLFNDHVPQFVHRARNHATADQRRQERLPVAGRCVDSD